MTPTALVVTASVLVTPTDDEACHRWRAPWHQRVLLCLRRNGVRKNLHDDWRAGPAWCDSVDGGTSERVFHDRFHLALTVPPLHQVAGLFEAIDASKTRVVVRLQYVEIYNEVVKDLLDPSDKITLDVREDPRQGTFVAGAASLVVGSREAVEDMLARGNQFRTTSATGCNEVSSRSHAVLQLRLETEKEGGAKAIGKLALIDLAGSERATKTDNRGQRLNEGANINRSLLALANCINALVQGGGPGAGRGRGHAHVPYRDSKLTRLLKDSLGGKSTTCIITNVSPASDQFEETINTLKYANRAKNIKTKAIEVRVERGPTLAPPTFAPTVKYEPAAAVEVRGVEDFLVRQERARLRQQQGGGGGLTRAASVPEARRGSVPAQAGAQRGPPRVAGRKAIRQPASDGSLPVARGNQLAGARGDAARPNPVSTGPSDPSSSGKSSLGLAAQKLQTVIAERVALVRREAIEAKIEQVRREEEQRRMEESFGGSKPRFR